MICRVCSGAREKMGLGGMRKPCRACNGTGQEKERVKEIAKPALKGEAKRGKK